MLSCSSRVILLRPASWPEARLRGLGSLAPLSDLHPNVWLSSRQQAGAESTWTVHGTRGAARSSASRRQRPEIHAQVHQGMADGLGLSRRHIVGFPAKVCESERGDGEKVSHAFVIRWPLWPSGPSPNEIERARYPLMARSSKAPSIGLDTDAQDNFPNHHFRLQRTPAGRSIQMGIRRHHLLQFCRQPFGKVASVADIPCGGDGSGSSFAEARLIEELGQYTRQQTAVYRS